MSINKYARIIPKNCPNNECLHLSGVAFEMKIYMKKMFRVTGEIAKSDSVIWLNMQCQSKVKITCQHPEF